MTSWSQILVGPDTPVIEVIGLLDRTAAQICLVVDGSRRLLGTITDGDVRRGILRGQPLDGPARAVMNDTPRVAATTTQRHERLALLRARKLRHLPLVDAQGVLVGLETEREMLGDDALPHWAVLMVGGLGERLRPLTATTPKPLLPVGGRPLLETILRQLAGSGLRRVYLAVNYMAEKFEQAFGDGAALGLDIRYLREDGRQGTAGALAGLPERPEAPMIVMTGDVLTTVNYRALLDFHAEHAAAATMCVREYDIEVPYGVVEIDQSRVRAFREKPVLTHFINAGIYVLSPSLLDRLEPGRPCDMPTLLGREMAAGGTVAAFPIREYWLDIGRMDDFAKANGDFDRLFAGAEGA